MSNAEFRKNFAAALAQAGEHAQTVVRQTAVSLAASMIQKSPVDTGRFKGNWQIGLNGINHDTGAAPDATGGAALARIQLGLSGFQPGQHIFITNSLPYSRKLEYDAWSKQAPAGMVRITVAEYAQKFAAAAAARP